MIDAFANEAILRTVQVQRQRAARFWWLWFALIMGVTAVTALAMITGVPTLTPVPLRLVVAIGMLVATAYAPRYGIYLILFSTLVGDSLLLPAYPFVKNFSSIESLFYINGALIFSPLELSLVLVLVIWLGRGAMQRRLNFVTGVLFWPMIFFTLMLVYGVVYGLGTGGNMNIALWEVRPIFYLILMMVFVSNLLEKPSDFSHMMWACMIALSIEGIIGTHYFFAVLQMDLSMVERITEHSAAIHMNTLFVFILAAWLYHASPTKRWLLLLAVPPVLLTYLATQRRAAFLSLGIALVCLAILLYREKRRLFWQIVPIVGILAIGYIGVFWNSGGALGLPAQAIKSVVAPEQGSSDAQSNLYREIENRNVSFTIENAPFTGVGFGNKFYIIQPMPDISFFIWWEYIVHNSIFWIWMKTGIFGFLSMLFMIGFSIMTGVRTLHHVKDANLKAVMLTATLYIVMHFLYAYVDMSWDNQSMIYVGAMLGVINAMATAVEKKKWEVDEASLARPA
ncbi:MAG: O-antigen ligase family protein [Caldilineaceae bacterium]|nr:O-antigen ligase family protein [Caldilineaceae bacterium]